MKLAHLGYAARDFDKAVAGFTAMGYARVHPEPAFQPAKNLTVMKLTMGDVIVEIMAATDPAKESFVTPALSRTQDDLVVFHLAYTVDDIDKTVADLTAKAGFRLLEPVAVGGNGSCKYCYMTGEVVGMIELLEFLK